MATDESHYLRLLTFGKGRQNLLDREFAQSHDGPAQFPARRVRNHKLCRRILQQCPRNIGYKQALADLCKEPAAGDLFST